MFPVFSSAYSIWLLNTQIIYIGRPRYIGTTGAKVGLRKITRTPSLSEKYKILI
jgi:hypothetical protein